MSDDDEGEEVLSSVFYRDDPEWKDVQPISQDDGPAPVVRIAYSEKFLDVYGYMRAVIKSGEKSQRVLQLTMDAIECNPANYTVWHYRRDVLKAINADLNEELAYIADIITTEPKNYQVWYHRQKVVEMLGVCSNDLELTAEVLEDDNKNYHAWQHRQWVIRRFDLWEQELTFVERFIELDLRNNSAWNERYFVLSRGNTRKLSEEMVQKEVEYTISYIKKAPQNETSWNYLHGVLRGYKLKDQPMVIQLVEDHKDDPIPSPYLLSTMVDIYEERLHEGDLNAYREAKELCSQLATTVDPIRKNYWDYVARRLANKHDELVATPTSS